jgi:F420-dependent oxidoreductase-like protein
VDLRIFTEPQQGATYDTLLAAARATEAAGFSAFFRSDHYLKMGDVSGLPGPTDAWTTLAGLARETEGIRLGTLVTAATFRHPGPLAITIAQVDQMSGGRVDVGIGTGWYDDEHTAYGIPFPPLAERFEILEEQLEVLTGLWRTPEGQTFDFSGRHVTIAGSPALPKPAQAGGPPIIIGGGGAKKTPALAARFASEFNLPFAPMDFWETQRERVRGACRDHDRDPDELTYSVALVACVGEDDAEIARRAAAIGRDVDELRQNGVCGTPDEAVARLREWGDAGAERIYLQVLDLDDLDHISLVGRDVLGSV